MVAAARVVLITGASSGLGLATSRLLVESGFTVFGTSRHPSACDPPPGVEMLPLDVRVKRSTEACVAEVVERAGRLDVLMNNAGFPLAGALEEATTEQAMAVFETNFFGVVRTVKAALPVMRRQGSGHIINISSGMARARAPFLGFYTATKCALEGYSESLWHELHPLNIRVSVVAPGFFRSNIESGTVQAEGEIEDYRPWREKAKDSFRAAVKRGADPATVARQVIQVIESGNPRLYCGVGRDSRVLPPLRSILPPALFRRVIRRFFGLAAVDKAETPRR